MGERANKADTESGTFLGRLRRDTRGNTLAIMAAALIPLAGMVGGGIDMSRMYITKTRLQHACDAGALAGRKNMGGGAWGADDQAVADQFFAANYETGAYGSTSLTHNYTESGGKISGTASAVLPMTLMKVLGFTTQKLEVSCNAEMRLPNTDIMFVLDTTGSMNDDGGTGDGTSKMTGLKKAVKCFYETVAKLDTDAVCDGTAPSGGTGSQVQIRFGFMPYSTNVNVGKLLPTDYLANSWPYQSREAIFVTQTTYTYDTQGTPTVTSTENKNITSSPSSTYGTYNNISSSSACDNKKPSLSATANGSESAPTNTVTTQNGSTQTVTYDTTQPYKYIYYSDSYNSSTKVCTVTQTPGTADLLRHYSRTDNGTPHQSQVFDHYHYSVRNFNVQGLKNGSSWKSSVTLPMLSKNGDRSVDWGGCIEERPTVKQSSYWPIPSEAKDLNIDLVPSTGDTTTQWGPLLPNAAYYRLGSDGNPTSDPYVDTPTSYSHPTTYCPTEAKKLQAWPDATAFDGYVDSLTPSGNTYHDIGMLWGARFISPTGIFASENALTPAGGQIERHVIFMTDGNAQSFPCDYQAYGIPWWDRLTTNDVGAASACGSDNANLDAQINARLDALCTAVKNMDNTTLWVISFGAGTDNATKTRLSNCATPGRYFSATNSTVLQQTFRSIADQISQLRLTQ